ncbi:hypothetical protein BpHYR1_008456 [Brachionus plicatilis]|uniref:Uncharacterized protein n=1 Tax=Brachionus plicatilis TaxID=10195 RepID=A0A3M7QK18_BRAPC|nr:hypothetical protein BpHYR1_008456 [Brachionus plicatilis]
MCFKTTCPKCSKPTWAGCGNHIEQALKDVPPQDRSARSILKLKYDTPSNIMHQETFNKLKLRTVSNRLFELSEIYVRAGLSNSVPLVVRIMEEKREEVSNQDMAFYFTFLEIIA